MDKKFADMDEDGNFVDNANIQEESSDDEKASDSEDVEVDNDFHEEEQDMNLDNDFMMQQGEDMDDIMEFDGQVNFDMEDTDKSLN